MSRLSVRPIVALVVCLAVIAVSPTAYAQLNDGDDIVFPPRDGVDDYGILRRAELEFDDDFIASLETAHRGEKVSIPLFDGHTIAAKTTRVEKTAGGFNWIGHVKTKGIGDVVLSVSDDALAGTVWIDDASYGIHGNGDDGFIIVEVDTQAFGPIHDTDVGSDADYAMIPLEHIERRGELQRLLAAETAYGNYYRQLEEKFAGTTSEGVLRAIPEPGTRVDVMIAYTTNASQWLARNGYSQQQPDPELQNLITKANVTLVESGIATQLNLVHVAWTSYDEANDLSLKTDRDNLTTPVVHGQLEHLHTLRDLHRADVVVLLVHHEPPDPGSGEKRYCGNAERLAGPADFNQDPTPNDGVGPPANIGFVVVNVDCAVLGHTVTHEMGHTFGAAHDNYQFDEETEDALAGGYTQTPAMPGGHGFILVGPNVRTVMAYKSFCIDVLGLTQDSACPVIPRFSNAQQDYDGWPLGIAVGATFIHPADNASVVNLTARTVANFRHAYFP